MVFDAFYTTWLACQPKNDLTPKNTTTYSTSLTVATFGTGVKSVKSVVFCVKIGKILRQFSIKNADTSEQKLKFLKNF